MKCGVLTSASFPACFFPVQTWGSSASAEGSKHCRDARTSCCHTPRAAEFLLPFSPCTSVLLIFFLNQSFKKLTRPYFLQETLSHSFQDGCSFMSASKITQGRDTELEKQCERTLSFSVRNTWCGSSMVCRPGAMTRGRGARWSRIGKNLHGSPASLCKPCCDYHGTRLSTTVTCSCALKHFTVSFETSDTGPVE